MFAYQLIQVVNIAFQVLMYLIIGRCILSFIRHDPYNPIIKFVYDVTEPVMAPFRRLLPMGYGIDFSPLLAVFALGLINKLLVQLIYIVF
ncbi:integral membrane protein yggt, involved in response to extracytoplasmic stress (osmotic shock) [hydrocarbon metagenome]|uniref:Integral membrane protein yggt, involved in response to extracytoplasmic stress (Osmotic shock) n=1 Tax=hydrocarbon metagenome TaxID=938273 RepID=A0A0W8E254_9ZZZZ